MKKIIQTLFLFAILVIPEIVFPQSYTLKLKVNNQPATTVMLGAVKGDDFIAIDSCEINTGSISFTFSKNNHPGIYRLILGKTTYAQVMNESPQHLDFIFNNEDLSFETDFKKPFDSCKIIQSDENKLWFSMLKKETTYRQELDILEKKVDLFWQHKDTVNAIKVSNNFNQKQIEWNLHLMQSIERNEKRFASRLLVFMQQPFQDGFLPKEERKKAYKKSFFLNLDFSNELLINSNTYTDKVFEYLILYNNPRYTHTQRSEEYIKAVDIIMKEIKGNQQVYDFLKAYLIRGFTGLQMEEVVNHLKNND